MSERHIPKRLLSAIVLLCGLALPAAKAEPAPWPDSPFTYLGREQRVERVLAGFANTFGLELRIESPLPDNLPPMAGRTSAANPTEFLNQLGAAYGLSWYYHSGVLYVSRSSERVTRMLSTKGMPGAALKRTFAEMGLIEPRFGWGDIAERGAVVVSGPASYVERIARALESFPDAQADQQVLVFRLKHASVDDRTIQYRDKQIQTPGVATLLRKLLGDEGSAGSTGTTIESAEPLTASSAMRPLVPDGPPPTSANAAGAQAAAGAKQASQAQSGPTRREARNLVSIQADSRLNAILIKDKPQNAPVYRELIAMLDVPATLIEIDAAIVDVNTSSMSELGVDWSAGKGKFSAGFSDGTLTLSRGVSSSTVVANAGSFLMANIRVLEGKGNARIVSRPFILTQENMGALIDVSDTFYLQTVGERVATVTPVSVGVTLRVTPRIVTDQGVRSVQLVVDIEDGAIQDAKVGVLPTVRRSTIGTQAVVGENESLLIGGLNSEQNIQSREQVPGLGSIPILGALFGRTSGTAEKRERLFLITPKVIGTLTAQAAPELPPLPARGERP